MNSPLNENPKTNRGLCLCQETEGLIVAQLICEPPWSAPTWRRFGTCFKENTKAVPRHRTPRRLTNSDALLNNDAYGNHPSSVQNSDIIGLFYHTLFYYPSFLDHRETSVLVSARLESPPSCKQLIYKDFKATL
jgi:hypothetical protein